MSGFEFTPMGILPIGTYREPLEEGHVAGATAHAPTVEAPEAALAPIAAPKQATPTISLPHLTPRDVMRLARARLRELDREIHRLHKLEKERDELRRLLTAAKAKPSNVRSLRTA